MMGEGDFAGAIIAADEGGEGAGMMWGAEGASSDNVFGGGCKGMEFSDGDFFGGGEWREEVGCDAGKHGFTGAGRAGEEEIMVAGDGDFKGAFGCGLAEDMV